MRILVVEDEPALADALQKAFTEESFAVDVATDGDKGLFMLGAFPYDAAVLDVMLPGRDGWSVLEQLRTQGNRTPVLLLTARDLIEDRVRGLNLGADDYLVKPFALAELIARVQALVRRGYGGAPPRITIGNIVIDSATRRVSRDGMPIELTSREYGVLELLARARGRLVTRQMLYEHLYNADVDVHSNVVDVHIAALRRKLGSDIIRTHRGQGYLIEE